MCAGGATPNPDTVGHSDWWRLNMPVRKEFDAAMEQWGRGIMDSPALKDAQRFVNEQARKLVEDISKSERRLIMSPAVSKKQRKAMAIAEHEPGKLYKRNKATKGMSKDQLHDFASTAEKGLPKKAKKR